MTNLEKQISKQLDETVYKMYRKAREYEPELTNKHKLSTILAILEHNKINPKEL